MAHAVERELKFRIPEGGDPATVRAAVESAGFTLEPTGTVLHEDRYLDTDDWTLYRAGIALRLRSDRNSPYRRSRSQTSCEPACGIGPIASSSAKCAAVKRSIFYKR